MPIRLSLVCFCLPLLLHGAACHAADEPQHVEVQLRSGRTFRGFVDPRTDEQTLWLRASSGQVVIGRPIQWDRVQAARHQDEALSAEDFRRRAIDLGAATPREPWRNPAREAVEPAAELRPTSWPLPGGLPPFLPPTVCSLHTSAQAINWDADAEVDGYEVLLRPLSHAGFVVPVEGTLQATLFGYQRRPDDPVQRWTELARWQQPLHLSCYGPDGAYVRLPFYQAVSWPDPRFDTTRRELHIRLTVPGHGTFETVIPHWLGQR